MHIIHYITLTQYMGVLYFILLLLLCLLLLQNLCNIIQLHWICQKMKDSVSMCQSHVDTLLMKTKKRGNKEIQEDKKGDQDTKKGTQTSLSQGYVTTSGFGESGTSMLLLTNSFLSSSLYFYKEERLGVLVHCQHISMHNSCCLA